MESFPLNGQNGQYPTSSAFHPLNLTQPYNAFDGRPTKSVTAPGFRSIDTPKKKLTRPRVTGIQVYLVPTTQTPNVVLRYFLSGPRRCLGARRIVQNKTPLAVYSCQTLKIVHSSLPAEVEQTPFGQTAGRTMARSGTLAFVSSPEPKGLLSGLVYPTCTLLGYVAGDAASVTNIPGGACNGNANDPLGEVTLLWNLDTCANVLDGSDFGTLSSSSGYLTSIMAVLMQEAPSMVRNHLWVQPNMWC